MCLLQIDGIEDFQSLRLNPPSPYVMARYKPNFQKASTNPTVKTLVLEACHDCNLACSYCFVRNYYSDHGTGNYMTFATAKSAIDRLLDRKVRLSTGFFGGEPMLNMKLIREVTEYVESLARRHGPVCQVCGGGGKSRGETCRACRGLGKQAPTLHVTTNGTLYSEDNLRFLQDHGYSVITSIDGTSEAHDALRPMKRSGKGSHAQILAGLERMKKIAPQLAARNTLRSTFSAIRGETIRERLEFLNQLCDDGKGSWVSVEPAAMSENTCFAGDTRVGLVDGTTRTMKEMADSDEWFDFYSFADDKVIATKGKVHLIKRNQKLVKLTVEDRHGFRKSLRCTPDHQFILKDQTTRRADTLQPGDSLLPFYSELAGSGPLAGYSMFLDPMTGKRRYTHRSVGHSVEIGATVDVDNHRLIFGFRQPGQTIVHHLNFNRLDNRPENLVWMTSHDHLQWHGLLVDKEKVAINLEEAWKDPEFRARKCAQVSEMMKMFWSDDQNRERMRPIHQANFDALRNVSLTCQHCGEQHTGLQAHAIHVRWCDHNPETADRKAIHYQRQSAAFTNMQNNQYDCPHCGTKSEGISAHAAHVRDCQDRPDARSLATVDDKREYQAAYKRWTLYLNKHDMTREELPLAEFRGTELEDSMRRKKKLKREAVLNHKVVSVEFLDELEDVYCPSVEHDCHNFAVMFTGEGLDSSCISVQCFVPNQDELEIHVGNVWDRFYDEYMDAADWWIERALSNKQPRFHNIHKCIERIFHCVHSGTECGAGAGYASVNAKGEIFGCHRESNSYLGTLVTGMDPKLRQPWLDNRIYTRTGPCAYETPIPLLDGTSPKIGELYDQGSDKLHNFYSCHDGRIIATKGRVVLAGVNASLFRVTLRDKDGVLKSARFSSEHQFLLRSGQYTTVAELQPGDSLMPLYRRLSTPDDDLKCVGYEMVLSPSNDQWVFTHRAAFTPEVAVDYTTEFGLVVCDKTPQHSVRHHLNFNKLDNRPDNIVWMRYVDHICLHSEFGRQKLLEYNGSESHLAKLQMMWHDPEYQWYRDMMVNQARENVVSLNHKLWNKPEYAEFRERLKAGNSEHLSETMLWLWNSDAPEAVEFRKRTSVRASRTMRRLRKDREFMRRMQAASAEARRVRAARDAEFRVKLVRQAKVASDAAAERWDDPVFRQEQSQVRSENAKHLWSDPEFRARQLASRNTEEYKRRRSAIAKRTSKERAEHARTLNTWRHWLSVNNLTREDCPFSAFREHRPDLAMANHTVVSVEQLAETGNVYCVEIDHECHNFATGFINADGTVSSAVFSHNCMNCGHRFACGGGCREDSLGDKGNIHEPSNVHCALKDMWVRMAMKVMAKLPKAVTMKFCKEPKPCDDADRKLLSFISEEQLPRDESGIVRQKWAGNIPLIALVKKGCGADTELPHLQDAPVDEFVDDTNYNPAGPIEISQAVMTSLR